MPPNQKTIAERLRLSPATVSRALGNAPTISPATRAKVMNEAARLGYRGPGARNSNNNTGGDTRTGVLVGVLVVTDDNHSHALEWNLQQHLSGMCEAAQLAGVTVTVHYLSKHDLVEFHHPERQPAALREGQLAGLVLLGDYPLPLLEKLSQQVHCVSVGARYDPLRIDSVDVQNIEAMDNVIGYLYNLGHRRIAFVNGFAEHSWVDERFAGYVAAVTRRNLDYSPELAVNFPIQFDRPEQQLETIMKLRDEQGVTALVCANDYAGYNLLIHAPEFGLSVPDDLSICGFDAVPPAFGAKQHLTSIRFPHREIGVAVVRRILERQANPAEGIRHVQFRCQLIEGDTTRPRAGRDAEEMSCLLTESENKRNKPQPRRTPLSRPEPQPERTL